MYLYFSITLFLLSSFLFHLNDYLFSSCNHQYAANLKKIVILISIHSNGNLYFSASQYMADFQ